VSKVATNQDRKNQHFSILTSDLFYFLFFLLFLAFYHACFGHFQFENVSSKIRLNKSVKNGT